MVRCRIAVAALMALSIAGAAGAQTLVPRPPDHPRIVPPGPRTHPVFTIASQRVDVSIDRQVAITTIEQTFRNETPREQEGIYLFPIPKDAAVSRYTMWMNGEEVEGEVVDAERARRIYQDIVRRSRDPALLEFVGCALLQARVYPIPARGSVRIKMSYEAVVTYDAGTVSYRLPLRWPGRVGDLAVGVDIRSDVPIRSVYSPTHEIDVRDARGRHATCGFEDRDVRGDRDFLLYYTVSESDVGMTLLTHGGAGADGYFAMLISPGSVGEDRIIDKDVVFVLDTSGSMKGEKIEQARAALSYCVERLRSGDRFNVIAFATSVETFEDGLVAASPQNRRRALGFVDGLKARGGTDIDGALSRALEAPRSSHSSRPRMIVFLTDGLPTVGERDIGRILVNARESNRGKARVFPFGLGFDVNTVLLDRLSEDHRGIADYVRPEEDIEERVSSFYNKAQSPVMSDIDLDFGSISVSDVYPRALPDLFDGSQLVVFGRYDGRHDGHRRAEITLTGRVGETERRLTYDARFERRGQRNAFIPRLWAARKIAYLLSEIKTTGRDPELVDAVIELSLEHGIVTPYTSFLILEDGDADDRRRLSRIAPEGAMDAYASEEVRARMVMLSAPKGAFDRSDSPEMKKLATGAVSTEVSRELGREKTSSVVREQDGLVRYVDARRFVLRDGEWVDSDVTDGMDVVDVEFLGAEYFALIDSQPELGAVLALGERVRFVQEGRCYRVIPGH